jgi:hypothetical protein
MGGQRPGRRRLRIPAGSGPGTLTGTGPYYTTPAARRDASPQSLHESFTPSTASGPMFIVDAVVSTSAVHHPRDRRQVDVALPVTVVGGDRVFGGATSTEGRSLSEKGRTGDEGQA